MEEKKELLSYSTNHQLKALPTLEINKSRAFTLTETLASVGILALLSVIAAPNLGSFIANQSTITKTADLVSSLQHARHTAVSTRNNVVICEYLTDNRCVSDKPSWANWQNGWLVFIDYNQNNRLDAQDNIVQSLRFDDHTQLGINNRGTIRFFADGSSRSIGFVICNTRSHYFRHIKIFYSGRIIVHDKTTEKNQKRCLGLH